MITVPDAAAYWEQRALRYAGYGDGLKAVCSFGMPRLYNRAIHVTQRRALRGLLTGLQGQRVLDVGCGVGRWSRCMAATARQVVGLDISPTMLAEARQRSASLGVHADFLLGGIAETRLLETFDTILCVTVIQHVRDEDVLAALQNLKAMLAPGGRLILMEVAPETPQASCDTAVFQVRSATEYRNALNAVGLEVVAERGVDVVPTKQLMMPLYSRLPNSVGRLLLTAATLAALPVDLLLARWLPRWSWHRVMIVRAAHGDA